MLRKHFVIIEEGNDTEEDGHIEEADNPNPSNINDGIGKYENRPATSALY